MSRCSLPCYVAPRAPRGSSHPCLPLTRLSQRLQRCELRGAAGGLGRPVPEVAHGDEQGARNGQCRWGSPCSHLPSRCRKAACCGEPTSSPTCLLLLLRAVPAFIQRRGEELSEADLHVGPYRHRAASPDCPEPVAAGVRAAGRGRATGAAMGAALAAQDPSRRQGRGADRARPSGELWRIDGLSRLQGHGSYSGQPGEGSVQCPAGSPGAVPRFIAVTPLSFSPGMPWHSPTTTSALCTTGKVGAAGPQ